MSDLVFYLNPLNFSEPVVALAFGYWSRLQTSALGCMKILILLNSLQIIFICLCRASQET